MDRSNEPKSPETLNNFDDFDNMFKGIDRDDYTPNYIASIVLKKVELERNPSRLDDAVEWFDEGYFYKIRDWVDVSACKSNMSAYELDMLVYDSEVSDIED